MDIKQLEYLIDIAELKSVTRAAEKNFMSQSTLSREVKILEKRIGVNLFVWDNREMRLTEEGILYLNGARELLQEYKKGMQALERLKAKQHQVIHLILSPKVQYFSAPIFSPNLSDNFHTPHWKLRSDLFLWLKNIWNMDSLISQLQLPTHQKSSNQKQSFFIGKLIFWHFQKAILLFLLSEIKHFRSLCSIRPLFC